MLKNGANHQFPGTAGGAGVAFLGVARAVPPPNARRVYAGRVRERSKRLFRLRRMGTGPANSSLPW